MMGASVLYAGRPSRIADRREPTSPLDPGHFSSFEALGLEVLSFSELWATEACKHQNPSVAQPKSTERILPARRGVLALAQPVKPGGTKSAWRMFRHELEELVVDRRERTLVR